MAKQRDLVQLAFDKQSLPRNPVPDSAARLAHIDGLRAVAMLSVFLYHCNLFSRTIQENALLQALFTPFSMSFGVSLFVAISGFCLYLPVAKNPHRPFQTVPFLLRRARRIYLPYFVVLCIYTALAVFVTSRGGTWVEGPNTLPEIFSSFVVHVAMIQAFVPAYCFTLDHPLWSLTLECSYYLLFPFFILLFRRVGPLYFYLGATLAAVSVHTLSTELYNVGQINNGAMLVLTNSFVMRGSEFSAGMLAAHWLTKRQLNTELVSRPFIQVGNVRWGWLPLFMGALLCFISGAMLHARGLLGNHLYGVSAFLLIVACCLPGVNTKTNWIQKGLSCKPLTSLGVLSYSFYLLHEPLLRLLMDLPVARNLNGTGTLLAAMPLFFFVILGISIVFEVLVTNPLSLPSHRRLPVRAAFPEIRWLGNLFLASRSQQFQKE